MENCYIVRLPDDRLLCFYSEQDKGIVYKSYQNNKWGRETPLLANALSHFTISLDKNGIIYLFCQNTDGHIILCTNAAGDWTNKVILQNRSGSIHSICLNPIITDKGLCLIYNTPNDEDKSNYLVFQALGEKGQWLPAARIDKFAPLNGQLFTVQHLSNEHVLLFYQTRTPESNLGYREMTPDAQGSYNIFHTTAYQTVDTSFLTTNNAVHVLFIVKTMFSYQLIYRNKLSETFSAPTVIWEAQSLDNCLLFFANDILYITYTNYGQLYCCTSNDNGATFSKPYRYRNKFCLRPLKATYISHTKQSEHSVYCRQLYVDSESYWDIQLLPDLYEDFYPSATLAALPAPETPVKLEPDNPEPTPFNEEQFILQNQLSISQKQIQEKNNEIMQLRNSLKKIKAEMHDIDLDRQNLAQKLAAAEQELATLKAQAKVETKEIEIGEAETEPEMELALAVEAKAEVEKKAEEVKEVKEEAVNE